MNTEQKRIFMQPQMTFAEDLAKPLHTETPPRWNLTPISDSEIDLSKVKLTIKFHDELLDTAYEDFCRFLVIAKI